MSENYSTQSITHIIFDLDGTLINSIDVLLELMRNYTKSLGEELSPDLERYSQIVPSLECFFQKFHESLEISDKPDSVGLLKIIVDKWQESKFELMPGVDRLVQHLRKHNIPMAIATGNSTINVSKALSKFGDYFKPGINFSHIVCGKDDPVVVHNKPHPEIFDVCSKRFQSQPKSLNNILIIEDSITGINCALNSGMRTLLVKDKRIIDSDITFNTEITSVINSLEEFIPENFGLPAF